MNRLFELARARLAYALARAPDLFVRYVTARHPIAIAGQRLEPRTQHALELMKRAGRPPLDQLPVERARREYAQFPRVFEDPPPSLPRIADDAIEGPAGRVPIRIYSSALGSVEGGEPRPLLVYYHGGGGVIGDLDTHDGVCRRLAVALDGVVVSIAYRMGPEHPFPAAPDDALAAYRAVVRRAAKLGGDPRRVVVGGDSMGGCLAAVVCQLARDAGEPGPAAQWLLYPATDRVAHRTSRRLYGRGFLLTEELMEWFNERYLGGADPHDPRVSPLRHPDLRGLPPAVLVTAGFDPLLDEGRAYADALAAAGVPVRYRCAEGLVHGFVQMTGAVPAARKAVLEAVEDLEACLHEA